MSTEPPLTLISATPSPYARTNIIALTLKSIHYTLINEIPWHANTTTLAYNPLEKLPILLFPDGRQPVYDSAHIQEYIVAKYADRGPRLLTGDVDLDLEIRQIVVLALGCLDAVVLANFEKARGEEKMSAVWLARQDRKIDGGMRAMGGLVEKRVAEEKEWLVGGEMSIADIAVVCVVVGIDFLGARKGWRGEYPELAGYVERVDGMEGFRETRPVMFELAEAVV